MQAEYLKPFVDGVQELVSTMLQSTLEVADATLETSADVSGVIALSGATQGQVALSFSRQTATLMVAQLLTLDETEIDDEMLGDGVGEMANIVAGAAKRRLAHKDDRLQLSLPAVTVSENHELSLFRERGVVHMRMVTSYGDFSLRVWFSNQC